MSISEISEINVEFHACLSQFLSSLECYDLRARGFIDNESVYHGFKTQLNILGFKFSTRTERKTKSQLVERSSDSQTSGGRCMFLNDNSVYSGHIYCTEKTSYKECCKGPHYYKSKRTFPDSENSSVKKTRFVYGTIKQNCPATMTVKKIRIFLNYKLPPGVSSWRQKKKLLETCQSDLEAKTVMRYEIEISTPSAHNHSLGYSQKETSNLLGCITNQSLGLTWDLAQNENSPADDLVCPTFDDTLNTTTEVSLDIFRKQQLFREICQQVMDKSYHCFHENSLDDMITKLNVVNSNINVIDEPITTLQFEETEASMINTDHVELCELPKASKRKLTNIQIIVVKKINSGENFI